MSWWNVTAVNAWLIARTLTRDASSPAVDRLRNGLVENRVRLRLGMAVD